MTLDTNVIIAYISGDAAVVGALNEVRTRSGPFLIPAAVEAEFLSFPKWSSDERETMETFLEENFLFIPLDRPLTRLAARIRASRRIKFADATIAATAMFTNTPLVTKNVGDFRNIPGLQVVTF
jgi:predicted nucleic acid-binding protein